MISRRKILQLARKWQKAAVVGRRRITLHGTSSRKKISGDLSIVRVAQKGHFAVYATDGVRFEIPVSYLGGRGVWDPKQRTYRISIGCINDEALNIVNWTGFSSRTGEGIDGVFC